MNEEPAVFHRPLGRRQIVSGLALTGLATLLPGTAVAQTGVPAAVRIVALSRLKKDYDTTEFEFDGIPSLLIRLPAASSDKARTLEVRSGSNSLFLAAFTRVCTHLGCTPGLPGKQTHLQVCPCHGSTYGPDGAVIKGPALRSLSVLTLEVRGADVYAVAQEGS